MSQNIVLDSLTELNLIQFNYIHNLFVYNAITSYQLDPITVCPCARVQSVQWSPTLLWHPSLEDAQNIE